MKKIISIFICLAVCFTFCACSSALERNMDNVSELRDVVLVSEDCNVSLISGKKEKEYAIDGISHALTAFTTIAYRGNAGEDGSVPYSVNINGKLFEGNMTLRPLDEAFSVTLDVECKSETITVTVCGKEYKLNSVKNSDFVTADQAFDVACKELKDSIASLDGKYEIYVRLVDNPISDKEGYFWYIAFVDQAEHTYAALIDPITLKVVASRK